MDSDYDKEQDLFVNSGLIAAVKAADGGRMPTTRKEALSTMGDADVVTLLQSLELKCDEPHKTYGYRNPNYSIASAAVPPGCPTKCGPCSSQWWTPAQTIKKEYTRNYGDEQAANAIHELKTEYAFTGSFISASYNRHCVVMYGKHYGKLVSWDKQAAHRLDMVNFPRGLLIFEAQFELSRFLRKALDVLGPQLSAASESGCGRHQELAIGSEIPSLGRADQATINSSHASPPPAFDLRQLTQAFKTRQHAAEDELWLLQTDPSYLCQHLSRFEGAMIFRNATTAEIREYKAKLVMLPLLNLQTWRYLVCQADKMLADQAVRSVAVNAGSPLPKVYEAAISCLEAALREVFTAQTENILTLVLCSKDLRDLYTGNEGDRIVMNHLNYNMSEKDPLYYHVMELARHDERTSYLAAHHFDMLEHILETSSGQSRRVDGLLRGLLSDMAAIDQALTSIRLHRPRNKPFTEVIGGLTIVEQSSKKREDEKTVAAREHVKHFQVRHTLQRGAVRMTHLVGYKRLHSSLEDFLQLPRMSRSINRDSIANFDESHRRLWQFWQQVQRLQEDQIIGIYLELGQQSLAQEQRQLLTAWSDKTHLDGVATERRALVAALQTKERNAEFARLNAARKRQDGIATIQTTWGQDSQEVYPTDELKLKHKTRPAQAATADTSAVSPEINSTATLDTLQLRTVSVDSNALQTFEQMYNATSDDQRDIKWDSFIAAMIDAGFSVSPSGGSVFTFTETSGRGRINFHRPHPDPSIDPIMLRSMGKRLKKWFGFGRETFVERKKEEV
ncbi:putative HicA mRNA interferase family [Septoria linicola]|nr:putative HicA mRNA interferase family [Septoria linicola]